MSSLFNPCQLYFDTLEKKVTEESEKFFNKLLEQSKINVEENKLLSSKYEESIKNLNDSKQLLNRFKTIKVIFIILIVVFSFTNIIFLFSEIYNGFSNLLFFIPTFIILLTLIIFFIIYLLTRNKKQINIHTEKSSFHKKESDELLAKCNSQINPLLSLFDYSDPDIIFEKITPLISLDHIFNKKKLAYLNEKGGIPCENTNSDSTTLYLKSGSINSHPFFIVKTRNHYMRSKTYHGTRVVSYTVSYTDSEGRRHTRTQFETLHASVLKPFPDYFINETLYFYSSKANNLSFNRKPFYLKKIDSEREYDKYIEKNIKNIRKEKKKSSSFVELNNEEFEVLFHALDRDDEREFRLLFTPLGQKSMVSLIKDSPYGDDFSFMKKKKTIEVHASHSLSADRTCLPSNYYSYSIDISKNLFVNYCKEYFKSFYFELAPILAIPLYQQTKKEPYKFKDENYPYNFSPYEHELVSNLFNKSEISKSQTAVINKTKYIESIGPWDIFTLTSKGFTITPRVDMIPRIAGNGRTYLVPVHWDEYIPIINNETIAIMKSDKNSKEVYSSYFNNSFHDDLKPYIKNNSYHYFQNKVFFVMSKKDTSIFKKQM